METCDVSAMYSKLCDLSRDVDSKQVDIALLEGKASEVHAEMKALLPLGYSSFAEARTSTAHLITSKRADLYEEQTALRKLDAFGEEISRVANEANTVAKVKAKIIGTAQDVKSIAEIKRQEVEKCLEELDELQTTMRNLSEEERLKGSEADAKASILKDLHHKLKDAQSDKEEMERRLAEIMTTLQERTHKEGAGKKNKPTAANGDHKHQASEPEDVAMGDGTDIFTRFQQAVLRKKHIQAQVREKEEEMGAAEVALCTTLVPNGDATGYPTYSAAAKAADACARQAEVHAQDLWREAQIQERAALEIERRAAGLRAEAEELDEYSKDARDRQEDIEEQARSADNEADWQRHVASNLHARSATKEEQAKKIHQELTDAKVALTRLRDDVAIADNNLALIYEIIMDAERKAKALDAVERVHRVKIGNDGSVTMLQGSNKAVGQDEQAADGSGGGSREKPSSSSAADPISRSSSVDTTDPGPSAIMDRIDLFEEGALGVDAMHTSRFPGGSGR